MRTAVLVILTLLVAAPTADAAGWTPTRSFGDANADQPAPRVAITAAGHSVLAYTRADGRLVASFDFGRPRVVGTRAPRDYAVAAGAIAYEASDGIHVVVRGHDRRVATSTGSEINGVAIAADPQGGYVVAERQFPRKAHAVPYRVRAFSVDADGRRVGDVQDLGLGEFGIDARPTQNLAVLPDGRAVLVFQRDRVQFGDPEPVVYAIRPHGGTFSAPAVVGDGMTDARVTVAGDRAVLTVTMTTLCGDTSCAGQPRAIALQPDGTLAAPSGPTVPNPSRAFAPWAAPGAVVFLLKTGPQPFSREAPVRAASLSGAGALQTLTNEKATEPVALALSDGRTLAVWATRTRLGAALAGTDGVFAKTAAPAGPPPDRFHDNATNRDARAAGRWVIVAWARGTWCGSAYVVLDAHGPHDRFPVQWRETES